jgi:DNA replication protein DnaC
MNQHPDEVLSKHIVCVDDIGTEGESMLYGNRRMVLAELADAAEREGKMLLLTTNMSVDELRQKYGERTIDRLRVVTKPILFNGESLRK